MPCSGLQFLLRLLRLSSLGAAMPSSDLQFLPSLLRLNSLARLPQASASPHLHLPRFGFLQAGAFPHPRPPPPLASPGLPQALPGHLGQLRTAGIFIAFLFCLCRLTLLSFYFGWGAFVLFLLCLLQAAHTLASSCQEFWVEGHWASASAGSSFSSFAFSGSGFSARASSVFNCCLTPRILSQMAFCSFLSRVLIKLLSRWYNSLCRLFLFSCCFLLSLFSSNFFPGAQEAQAFSVFPTPS